MRETEKKVELFQIIAQPIGRQLGIPLQGTDYRFLHLRFDELAVAFAFRTRRFESDNDQARTFRVLPLRLSVECPIVPGRRVFLPQVETLPTHSDSGSE